MQDVEFWLELSNFLMAYAAVLFIAGAGLGYSVGRWLMRRAAAEKQKAWLKEQQAKLTETRREFATSVAAFDPVVDFYNTHCRNEGAIHSHPNFPYLKGIYQCREDDRGNIIWPNLP